MTKRDLTKLTDEELLKEKRKLKNTKIINATLIGFLVGIVIWSIAKNTWGFLTLIPLFFIYKLVRRA
ncbi:MAG: FUSC family protein [Lewinellaceae bacterium]|nr:FUSC family protein [Lewinellaceae bacterium]